MLKLSAKSALAHAKPISNAGVTLHEEALAVAHLSARREDPAYLERAAHALGVDLPRKPNTVASRGATQAAWIAPDQWLIIGTTAEGIDVSDAYCAIRLIGARVTDVLSKSVPVDLSETGFPPLSCTRTLLGSIPAFLMRDSSGFLVLVDRGLANAAWSWLSEGAAALTR
jgi:heterotetrameric sarcosine oxidase gamma subunit